MEEIAQEHMADIKIQINKVRREPNSDSEAGSGSESDNIANQDFIIDINDYEIPTEELDYGRYVDMLNIFTIYQKTLYNKNKSTNLFDGINYQEPSATNREIEKLYEEIYHYKMAQQNSSQSDTENRFIYLYNPADYKNKYLQDSSKLPEDYPFYIVSSEAPVQEYVSHNLITILDYISSLDWRNVSWSINQINEF